MKVKRSNYFIPFKKETDSQGSTAWMIKGGFINKHAAGMFSWLPLGLRMLEKVIDIIVEEHEKVGAQKMLMPILQEASLWKTSGRYEGYGSEMLKIYDRHEREFIYGPSAEEMFTQLVSKWQLNKSSLPIILYNIQWKFRDEIRPRFGVVRSREFLMKDAYSFDKTEEAMMETYKKMFEVYSNIFAKLNLPVCTFSSDVGVIGGNLTHEFVIKSEFGESLVEFDNFPSQPLQWEERDNVKVIESREIQEGESKYAEIAQIYALGQKYSQPFNLVSPENQEPVYMGCYGIGVTRLIAIIFENSMHDLGICAPFENSIITIGQDSAVNEVANKIYNQLKEVIWDNTDSSYGIKCAQADLIGSKTQIHIGKKDLDNNQITLKENGMKTTITIEEAFNKLNIK